MVYAVIVAAGQATRMGGGDKNMLILEGKQVLRHCLEVYQACDCVDGIVLVTTADRLDRYSIAVSEWGIGKLKAVLAGGETRSHSVYQGLLALPEECSIVAIHDCARPFVTGDMIRRTVESAQTRGSGVAAIRCRDTVKVAGEEGLVSATPDRESLWLVQTPQTFQIGLIKRAYACAMEREACATDDAAIAEQAGEAVYLVEGSVDNIKLTTPEDIRHGEAILRARTGEKMMRIGEGYDVHRLVQGRALIIGGVSIPHHTGLLGHSDADVLLHAIMDALLGAAALGDIGKHFPDQDKAYEGISSLLLLRQVGNILAEHGCQITGIDATVVAQKPKLSPHIPSMRENIANALGLSADQVNIKATTTEGLGFEGREEGISARAVALINKTVTSRD